MCNYVGHLFNVLLIPRWVYILMTPNIHKHVQRAWPGAIIKRCANVATFSSLIG